eukprot:1222671-Prymnesium_polylepis.1
MGAHVGDDVDVKVVGGATDRQRHGAREPRPSQLHLRLPLARLGRERRRANLEVGARADGAAALARDAADDVARHAAERERLIERVPPVPLGEEHALARQLVHGWQAAVGVVHVADAGALGGLRVVVHRLGLAAPAPGRPVRARACVKVPYARAHPAAERGCGGAAQIDLGQLEREVVEHVEGEHHVGHHKRLRRVGQIAARLPVEHHVALAAADLA